MPKRMTKSAKISQILKSRGLSAKSAQGKQAKAMLTAMKATQVTKLHDAMARQGQQMIQQVIQQQYISQPVVRRKRSSTKAKGKATARGYAGMNLVQLRKKAKQKKIKGYSTLKKAQLIAKIKAGPAKAKKGRKAVAQPSASKVKRANAIARAIRSGTIAAKNSNITSYTKYQSGSRKQKVDRFVAQYKGVTVKKRATASRQSVASMYQGMASPKDPYFLSRGYKVSAFKVGGGGSGPGTVRKIAGKQGLPFSKLTMADKKKIIAFLNSATGKKLRGVGAKQQASLQAMQQAKRAKMQKRKSRSVAKSRAKKTQAQLKRASANMFYGWY